MSFRFLIAITTCFSGLLFGYHFGIINMVMTLNTLFNFFNVKVNNFNENLLMPFFQNNFNDTLSTFEIKENENVTSMKSFYLLKYSIFVIISSLLNYLLISKYLRRKKFNQHRTLIYAGLMFTINKILILQLQYSNNILFLGKNDYFRDKVHNNNSNSNILLLLLTLISSKLSFESLVIESTSLYAYLYLTKLLSTKLRRNTRLLQLPYKRCMTIFKMIIITTSINLLNYYLTTTTTITTTTSNVTLQKFSGIKNNIKGKNASILKRIFINHNSYSFNDINMTIKILLLLPCFLTISSKRFNSNSNFHEKEIITTFNNKGMI
ncbi:hypothetical protein BCR32DRAFT_295194 [Anaeromyces robustus]|uniref:Uncharacterized protein n=1 Tax=Anaeromyces robustus TaxID=1754192 RepID=A0A1Y1WX99_9FUNG|nr:hypothetical protein BCR32DRAFT_295194 [Anaeromyces robustus]|eukprot:ORX78143.1 hypothetical protein BCR32DRAFT_295194 [Anaeromyces robustus]